MDEHTGLGIAPSNANVSAPFRSQLPSASNYMFQLSFINKKKPRFSPHFSIS